MTQSVIEMKIIYDSETKLCNIQRRLNIYVPSFVLNQMILDGIQNLLELSKNSSQPVVKINK